MMPRLRAMFLNYLPAGVAQRIQFAVKEPTRSKAIRWTGDERKDAILRTVEQDGFAVLPNYFTRAECKQGIAEFETATVEFPEYVHHLEDERLFGAEHVSSIARRFGGDPLWVELSEAYCGERCGSLLIMANKVEARPDQCHGSGGGWHRDCFARELKVMVYLSDVSADNGPFQLLRQSHTSEAILRDMANAGLKAVQNRIEASQASRLLERDPARYVRLAAPAGTAIVFDTSSIHAGARVQSGTRYALTNYLVTQRVHNAFGLEHYRPVMTEPPVRRAAG